MAFNIHADKREREREYSKARTLFPVLLIFFHNHKISLSFVGFYFFSLVELNECNEGVVEEKRLEREGI
jgi:hypothetical protein